MLKLNFSSTFSSLTLAAFRLHFPWPYAQISLSIKLHFISTFVALFECEGKVNAEPSGSDTGRNESLPAVWNAFLLMFGDLLQRWLELAQCGPRFWWVASRSEEDRELSRCLWTSAPDEKLSILMSHFWLQNVGNIPVVFERVIYYFLD